MTRKLIMAFAAVAAVFGACAETEETVGGYTWTLLYNGDSQVVMVARKDNGFGTAVFSDRLLKLFKEGL